MNSDTIQATVVIPTRNRYAVLRDTLHSVLAQTVPVEVLVMDDGSTDGTAERLRAEFPQVRFYRTDESHGPTVQRNRAAKVASTPFLFTIDDDCVLQSPRTVSHTLALFDHPRVGGVTIPFINVKQDAAVLHSAAPAADQLYATCEYYGGMVAFRRDLYLDVGGYRPAYFMQGEERDLAVRLLSAGYIVRLGCSEPIHHYESAVRDQTRIHKLGARNHVLYSWYNVPMPYLPLHLAATTLLAFRHGLRIGHPLLVFKALVGGYFRSLAEWKQRRPLSPEIYRLSRNMKKRGSLPLCDVEPRLPRIPPNGSFRVWHNQPSAQAHAKR